MLNKKYASIIYCNNIGTKFAVGITEFPNFIGYPNFINDPTKLDTSNNYGSLTTASLSKVLNFLPFCYKAFDQI